MLPPNRIPLARLAQEEGISEATLSKWRREAREKGQLIPDANGGPEGWTAADKFAAVVETSALNEADLSEYCRRRGLYPEQLRSWRLACEQAHDWDRASMARLDKTTREVTGHTPMGLGLGGNAMGGARNSFLVDLFAD